MSFDEDNHLFLCVAENAFHTVSDAFLSSSRVHALVQPEAVSGLTQTIALVVHDVMCPWQVIPFSGPRLPVCEMRG